MKRLLWILAGVVITAAAVLGACGGSSEEDIVAVEVEGNIYNEGVGAGALSAEAGTAPAPVVINSSWSTLQVRDPIRLPAVSQGLPIIINGTASNVGTVDLANVKTLIGWEDAVMLRPEYWICWYHKESYDGTQKRNSEVWSVYGGTLIEPQPAPGLPECTGEPKNPDAICDPATYDCENITYWIEHIPPGDGLKKSEGTIYNFPANTSVYLGMSGAHSAIDIRDDHYAVYRVTDINNSVLAEKYYVIDVTP